MARGNTVLSGAVDLSAANKGVIADNAFASSTLPTASPDLIGAALELTPEPGMGGRPGSRCRAETIID